MTNESFCFSLSESDSAIFGNSSQIDCKNEKKFKNENSSFLSHSEPKLHNSYQSNHSKKKLSSKNQNEQLSNNQFFTHLFICIHRYEQLYKCQMQTLFARIRIHPKISIIQTNNSMCVTNQVIFNCSYALDFRSVANFRPEDYTPVIELYRRISNKAELVGMSMLPLKVMSTEIDNQKPLTYFYHNSIVPTTDIMTGGFVGNLLVSLGTGFIEHQDLFNPNLRAMRPQNIIDNNDHNKEENIERNKSKHSHRKHHHKKKANKWQKIATAAGWKPKDFVSNEWKSKAIKKGWIPPEKQMKSSIAIECKKDDVITKETVSTQYEPVLIPVINHQEFNDSSSESKSEIDDIINLLNPTRKKAKKHDESSSSDLSLMSPTTVFEKVCPVLSITPVINLLNVSGDSDSFLSESTDLSDSLSTINLDHLLDQNIGNDILANKPLKLYHKKQDNLDIYHDRNDMKSLNSSSSSANNMKNIFGNIDPNIKELLDIFND